MPDSPPSEPESDFVCDCEESMRSACYGEPSYKVSEHKLGQNIENKRYCVLHLPSRNKSPEFSQAVQQKLDRNDFNFRGVWFPSSTSFKDSNFETAAEFTKAVFNDVTDFGRSVFGAGSNFDDAIFRERVVFDQVSFEGSASFHGTKFLGYASFGRAKFAEQVSFLTAAFSSGANFHMTLFAESADFHGSKIGGMALFRGASFSKDVDFERASFQVVNFENCVVGSGSNFSNCIFELEANYFGAAFVGLTTFHSVAFKGAANFRQAKFSALASFERAIFSSLAYFSGATFDGEAGFSETTFESTARFNRTNFAGSADFSHARFNDIAEFFGDDQAPVFGDDSSLDLQHCRVEKAGNLSFHTLRLRPHWFVNVDARKVDFTNVDWYWRSIDDEIRSLAQGPISSSHELLAIASQQLAVNAEENNRYDEAASFRFLAMELRRRQSWQQLKSAPLRWRSWKRLGLLRWLYGIASGYGERSLQALIVLLSIWFLFGMTYTRIGFGLPNEAIGTVERHEVIAPLRFSRALTYSAAVMTLQKPEPRPATTAAQTVVLLETILGPVQAALLALAIRRKFMR